MKQEEQGSTRPTGVLRRWRAVLAAALAATCLAAAAQAPAKAIAVPPPPPPPPLLRVPNAEMAVRIARVQVDAQVVGRAAHTRVEMEFYNPNPRVLEGEVQFPLRAGQTVTGFALDIAGELRAAVPVEKEKGRQVFEDVTRARVDPALLESTEGNNYRVRVYPLPARGSRRVVLELSESLSAEGAGVRYLLPLAFGGTVQQLQVTVRLPREGALPRSASFGPQRLDVRREADGSPVVSLRRENYAGSHELRVELAQARGAAQLLVQPFRDANYFYAEVPVAARMVARRPPRTLAIVWDASGSAAGRDLQREFALLDAYFRSLRSAAVDLVVVRDEAEPVRSFQVEGGDWRALREHLEGLPFDGATRLDRMAVPTGAELALLFTDGIATYGERRLPPAPVPVYAVGSSAGADARLLRAAAEATGGGWLDLMRLSATQAARELQQQAPRLLAVDADGAADVVSQGVYPRQGRLVLAGRLDAPEATLAVHLQAADGSRSTRRVRIAAPARQAQLPGQPLAAYQWAALRLGELEADPERNQQAIRRLGREFALVTSGTSLIVLDTVDDYARYEIEPPLPLRAAYETLLARRQQRREHDRQAHLERVVQRFAARQAWWEKDFPKDLPPPPPPPAEAARDAAAAEARRAQGERREAPQAVPSRPAPLPAPSPAPAPAPAPAARPAPAAPAAAAPGQAQAPGASIALQQWTPDAAYVRRLKSAAPEAMYAIYLDERAGYTRSTAFFLDVADLFFQRGQDALARRILSNLAEMDLGNRHILRILAYRLLQAREVKLALPLLRKVLALSPDEPQSYRDLGLALAADGQPQAAIEQLWEVVSRPWHNRFPDVEQTALAELNAVAARALAAGQPLDTAMVDRRLLRNLPLDLRAVLTWDADNTDIDLYVTDPNGETAHYGRKLTTQGGRMSADFTGGYGPEEFALRRAKPGTYTVRAHFYGHRQQIVAPATTLMLRLSTGFGTPAQQDADVVLRLSGGNRQVTVGTFEVAPPPAAPAQ